MSPDRIPQPVKNPSDTRVIVGMSGGVDSSVSALLLCQQGYQVEGLFMKNWDEDDGTEYCTAKVDLEDAQQVCEKLDIPLNTANFAAEYWDQVFENFLTEHRAGRTPNPDILCNREIKFKVFLEYAELLGADYIATGHYARLNHNKTASLLRGLDGNKDQSYFLYAVSEQAFAKTLFPIGELIKPQVRQLAEQHDLGTYNNEEGYVNGVSVASVPPLTMTYLDLPDFDDFYKMDVYIYELIGINQETGEAVFDYKFFELSNTFALSVFL